jgi:uncharacterized membrane protein
MKADKSNNSESRFEKTISYLLITGVIISLILEIIGVVMLSRSYDSFDISHEAGMYIKGHDFFSFIYQQIQDRQTTEPSILFMILGIIVLILTPYVRVIASVVYFAWQKNLKYVLITLFVLIVVTLSLALH